MGIRDLEVTDIKLQTVTSRYTDNLSAATSDYCCPKQTTCRQQHASLHASAGRQRRGTGALP